MNKLKKGIEIFLRNKKEKDEYKQQILNNLKKRGKVKRNFVLEPIKLSDVMGELGI